MRGPRWATALLLVLPSIFVAGLGGCSGGDDPTQPEPTTGTLAIDVDGLPPGTDCSIGISGPDFFSTTITGDATLEGLAPGSYGLSISAPIEGYTQYRPANLAMTVTVSAGETTSVPVNYTGTVSRGHLQVDMTGLPDGTVAELLVTGPSSFSRTVTEATTFESVLPGIYRLTADPVSDGEFAYVPSEAVTEVDVVAGQTASRQVLFAQQEMDDIDFTVAGVEIIQAVQRDTGDVPLIRSRDALLRVYLHASESTAFVPDVGLEIRVNGTVVDTRVLTPDFDTVPTSTDRGDLSNSVNWVIPATFVQPGLEIRATADPEQDYFETNEDNNAYPDAASYASYAVASVDAYGVTLVPVHQSANGTTGDVNGSNATDYTEMAEAIYPVPSVPASVRATYTTDAPVLQSNDGNGAWNMILQEVQALRAADASDDNYFGVVPTTYGSGIAGLGYIPSSRTSSYRAAIGWDKSNSRGGVAAHELGHNLGRYHAPCGGAANTDPGYPYGGGLIGHWGYDPRDGDLIDPTSAKDIMTYCNPQWISDYNFELVLDFLDGVVTPRTVSLQPQPCLLIWGRIANGEIELDPAAVITARPTLPTAPGAYRVDVVDDRGRALFDLSFDPPRVGCAEDDVSSFVWLVPVDAIDAARIGTVAVTGRGATAVQEARTDSPAMARRVPMALDRTGARSASLRWDASSLPLAIVRDARDGTVLAIGRHGDFDFACEASAVDVVFSDGTRTLEWSHTLD